VPSRTEPRWRRALCAALTAAVLGGAVSGTAAAAASADARSAPDRAQIERALAQVKADPNISSEQTVHALRWESSPERPAMELPNWLRWLRFLKPVLQWLGGAFGWLGGAAAWLAESGRALLWVAAAVLVGLLAVYLVRLARVRGPSRTAGRFVAPSHVRDLDIRPESLPEDVGAAAWALWTRGDHRGALALLYRGLLSRLVHVHGVAIRDSSTEGDCLVLAGGLAEQRRRYATRLIHGWQRAVYSGERLETTTVQSLCAEFAAALDAPQTAESGGEAAAEPA